MNLLPLLIHTHTRKHTPTLNPKKKDKKQRKFIVTVCFGQPASSSLHDHQYNLANKKMRLFYGNLKEMEHNDQNRYRAYNGPLEYTN